MRRFAHGPAPKPGLSGPIWWFVAFFLLAQIAGTIVYAVIALTHS